MAEDLAPIPRWLAWPMGLSALAFALLVGLASGSVVPLYYPAVLAFGALGWRYRARLPKIGATFWQRIALGYLAVIAEESLAGLLHGLAEGGAAQIVLARIGQFIGFNLLAFTGIIFSLAYWRGKVALTGSDLFWVAGCWGLFAEGSLRALISAPLAGALLILPNMGVYAVILWPMTRRPARQAVKVSPKAFRMPLIWATAFALSLPPIAALSALRIAHPTWFPPCDYIAC